MYIFKVFFHVGPAVSKLGYVNCVIIIYFLHEGSIIWGCLWWKNLLINQSDEEYDFNIFFLLFVDPRGGCQNKVPKNVEIRDPVEITNRFLKDKNLRKNGLECLYP